jgi:hypothetical protein
MKELPEEGDLILGDAQVSADKKDDRKKTGAPHLRSRCARSHLSHAL